METIVNPQVIIRNTLRQVGVYAAEFFASEAVKARAKTGPFTVAFSGGSTPRELFNVLATDHYRSKVPWDIIHFFWTDERCVPPNHPMSNFRLAFDCLLAKTTVTDINIHRILGELPPAAAAAAYRHEIEALFGPVSYPVFDLILLGIGEDGHTASLFPETGASSEEVESILPVYVEKLQEYRVTMTLPVINSAHKVVFMAAGKAKSKVINDILEGSNTTLPAARVNPPCGELLWVLDREAASELSEEARNRCTM